MSNENNAGVDLNPATESFNERFKGDSHCGWKPLDYWQAGYDARNAALARRASASQISKDAGGEPVAWMIWLHGPAGLFENRDAALLELGRRNGLYPNEANDRKLIRLSAGAAAKTERHWIHDLPDNPDSIANILPSASAEGAGSEQSERTLFMQAIDSTYPIPDTPHQSVADRAMVNREAFNKGWEQARAARAPLPEQDDARDARDAARWRFIVKDGKNISGRFTLVRADDSGRVDELHGGEYDRVIDAAMSASRPDDKGDKA